MGVWIFLLINRCFFCPSEWRYSFYSGSQSAADSFRNMQLSNCCVANKCDLSGHVRSWQGAVTVFTDCFNSELPPKSPLNCVCILLLFLCIIQKVHFSFISFPPVLLVGQSNNCQCKWAFVGFVQIFLLHRWSVPATSNREEQAFIWF